MSTLLSDSVAVYRAMQRARVIGTEATGVVTLSGPLRSSVQNLVNGGLALEMPVGLDGAAVEFSFLLPRGQSEFFANDWDDLLNSHNFRYEGPGEYYVAVENFFSGDAQRTVGARRYRSVQSLIKVMREVADYTDNSISGVKFVFLSSTKLEVPIKYTATELRDIPKVADLEADVIGLAVKHQEQRKTIIKVLLLEMLGNVVIDKRFTEFLKNYSTFAQRYKDSYDLYVAEFSFEKILKEVQSNKLEYTIKLNKVFSDIQNQLLAIPAALILIGSKMTPQGRVEWQNSLTMLGCVIFVALMNLLIRNQYHSLNAIDAEIKQESVFLIKEHAALLSMFSDPYAELERRYSHQKILIKIVEGLVAAMFLFCVALYYWYSTGPYHWLKYAIVQFF